MTSDDEKRVPLPLSRGSGAVLIGWRNVESDFGGSSKSSDGKSDKQEQQSDKPDGEEPD